MRKVKTDGLNVKEEKRNNTRNSCFDCFNRLLGSLPISYLLRDSLYVVVFQYGYGEYYLYICDLLVGVVLYRF